MIEKYLSDGTFVRVQPSDDGIGPRLHFVFDDEAAAGGTLEPEEAAEIGLALLRWAADAVRGNGTPSLHVAVESSLDRTSRLLGTALVRDGA